MKPSALSLKSLLHRRLWQQFPYRWRRAALFHATVLAAPRPSPHARPAYPFLVAGELRTASGLGESARLCHEALRLAGLPVLGADFTAALMQPEDCSDFMFADARAHEGPGTIILHVNSPLVPLAMTRLGSRLVREKRIVGYWAWELPAVPTEWRHGIRFVHEIWVPSRFTAEAVAPIAAGTPVRVVPHPVALTIPPARAGRRIRSDIFTVLTIFNMASSFARKNPVAAIEAFRMAFGDDSSTRLIVKASNSNVFPQGLTLLKALCRSMNNIVLIDHTMSRTEIDALYSNTNCFMSLHRSEGFGLTIAEAMVRGLPVIATDWSGSSDFVSSETGIPVPARLIPAEDPQRTYHHAGMMWADADVSVAADALRELRDNPARAARLGQAAANFAAKAWSTDAYASTVRAHLGL